MEFNKTQQKNLYDFLIVIGRNEHRTLTPEEVEGFAFGWGKQFGLEDEEIQEVIREYKIVVGVTMPHISMLSKDADDEWFKKYKDNPDSLTYWRRYKDYLEREKHFSPSTLETMEEDIMRTIAKFADPSFAGSLSKKGLVVGDVQSGKTANYIGLINMAVDAGYRNIVLLAGMTEDLRVQTQGRVDEGFVGGKSSTFKDGQIEPIGVSQDGKHYGVSFTTTRHDFNAEAARSVAASISDYNKPVISVIKKNRSVIQNLNAFISGNAEREALPLLIIDDECDNASINTQSAESPTSINEKIRELFSKYRIVTYVGFSATPYANIFVDPDADYVPPFALDDLKPGDVIPDDLEQLHVPDLFPDDFIILLEPPADYVGAEKLFLGFNDDDVDGNHDGRGNENIVLIGNPETDPGFFPAKHKKTDVFTSLCPSLKESIYVFILSSCVYSMRKHSDKHRSMLINISRFNDTQSQISELVKRFVSEIKIEVDAYSTSPMPIFMSHPHLSRLKEVWENDTYFGRLDKDGLKANCTYSFDEVRSQLRYEMSLMEVAIINGTIKKKERFRYDDDLHKDVGARVIVVGGFALSRGLTLEGLMTSYYNRNASAFDVLLQMGRWFGYRHDYEDLVSVFMTQTNLDCFCAVTESSKDLKTQFRRMAKQNKTPREFGLMIREAPDTLEHTILITARNKSRNSEDYVREISLSGTHIDTSKITYDLKAALTNDKATKKFFQRLLERGFVLTESIQMPGHFYFKDVPAQFLIDYLSEIEVSYANNVFDPSILIPFIRKTRELSKWDITVATGSDSSRECDLPFGDKPVRMPQRSFKIVEGDPFIRVGGSNNRLIDPGLFKIDLDKDGMEAAKENRRDRIANDASKSKTINPEQADFTAHDLLEMECRNPLFIIFPLDLKIGYDNLPKREDGTRPDRPKGIDKSKERIRDALQGTPLYGFGMGFPGNFKKLKTIYRINLVKKNSLLEGDLEDLQDEDENYEDEIQGTL